MQTQIKTGNTIEEAAATIASAPTNINGLHIHTNADSHDLTELLANVHVIIEAMPKSIKFDWVNLGGGYIFEEASLDLLAQSAQSMRHTFGADVYIEPGAALVRSAGYLVTAIIDIIDVDGGRIAVLDTTVNHMPEVLVIRL